MRNQLIILHRLVQLFDPLCMYVCINDYDYCHDDNDNDGNHNDSSIRVNCIIIIRIIITIITVIIIIIITAIIIITTTITITMQTYIKTNQLDDALEFLARTLYLEPDNVKALSRKAFALGQYDDDDGGGAGGADDEVDH